MNELHNGNVPILGEQKPRAMPQMIVSLVRSMDSNGTFEPESTVSNGNQVQAIAGRGNIMSGEDLVEMIIDGLKPALREIVRDERARQRLND